MAQLIKRGDRYYVRLYVGNRATRDIPTKTGDERLARRIHARFEARDPTLGLPTSTPLAPLLDDFVDHLAAKHPRKSARNDVSRLRQIFGTVALSLELPQKEGSRRRRVAPTILAKRRIEDLSVPLINRRLDERARTVGPKSVNADREILSRLFAYAIEHHGVVHPETGKENPIRRVKRRRERAPEIRFLTAEQAEAQLRALADRPSMRLAVALMVYAGLRRAEALWLRVDDVDRAAGLIRVRAKADGATRWQPKTGRNRAVPISRALARELDDAEGRLPASSAWLCPSPKGSRWDPDNFSHALADVNGAAGLPWTCLDFRHTFGSLLAQKGVSLYKISACMGNSPEVEQAATSWHSVGSAMD